MIVVDVSNTETYIAPEDIYGMLLARLKEVAEKFLESNVTNVVVSVPANYNDNQRNLVQHSGEQANLTVLRIVNEPTAAAIAYGLDITDGSEQLALVYDIGATRTDATVLIVEAGVFEIIGTASTHVGGENFKDRLKTR
jgi:heat shock protein 5